MQKINPLLISSFTTLLLEPFGTAHPWLSTPRILTTSLSKIGLETLWSDTKGWIWRCCTTFRTIFTTLWAIWSHGNLVVREGKHTDPMEVILTVQSLTCTYQVAFNEHPWSYSSVSDCRAESYISMLWWSLALAVSHHDCWSKKKENQKKWLCIRSQGHAREPRFHWNFKLCSNTCKPGSPGSNGGSSCQS